MIGPAKEPITPPKTAPSTLAWLTLTSMVVFLMAYWAQSTGPLVRKRCFRMRLDMMSLGALTRSSIPASCRVGGVSTMSSGTLQGHGRSTALANREILASSGHPYKEAVPGMVHNHTTTHSSFNTYSSSSTSSLWVFLVIAWLRSHVMHHACNNKRITPVVRWM